MSKPKPNPMISQINGKMEAVVFRLLPTGEAMIEKRPDTSRVAWTEAQKAQQESFNQATAYARAVMAAPDVRAFYEKMGAKEHKRPFTMAFTDYFRGNNLLSKK
jgi:hypothetical protein